MRFRMRDTRIARRGKGPTRARQFLGWLPFALVAAVLTPWIVVELWVQSSVESQLGFSYATPRIPGEGEIFEITRVLPGPMAQAGVAEGDRVRLGSVPALFRRLIEAEGQVACIPLSRGGVVVVVRIAVPRLVLPFSRSVVDAVFRWAALEAMPPDPCEAPLPPNPQRPHGS